MTQFFECPRGHRLEVTKATSVMCHCHKLYKRITKLPPVTEKKALDAGADKIERKATR